MGHSHYDPTFPDRCAWNAGKKVGTKRPLKPRQIWAIRFFLDRERRMRDRALFDLAIDSKLRGCDLVKTKIGTLVTGPEIQTRAMVVQQKTGRPVQFELMSGGRASLLAWLERRGGTVDDFAFPSRIDRSDHMSTRQYARLVDEWVSAVGLRREEYGTHSIQMLEEARLNYARMGARESRIVSPGARSAILATRVGTVKTATLALALRGFGYTVERHDGFLEIGAGERAPPVTETLARGRRGESGPFNGWSEPALREVPPLPVPRTAGTRRIVVTARSDSFARAL